MVFVPQQALDWANPLLLSEVPADNVRFTQRRCGGTWLARRISRSPAATISQFPSKTLETLAQPGSEGYSARPI
jgi:hypothetical protein